MRYGGASGQLAMRADRGCYTHAVVSACRETNVRYSITVRQHARLRNIIEDIPEADWTPIPYWMDGAADVAETDYTPFQSEPDAAPVRLIVRRVQPTPGSQLALFASYSYHAFITDREGDTLELEADHRRHAEIENAIRDPASSAGQALKYGVGLPSPLGPLPRQRRLAGRPSARPQPGSLDSAHRSGRAAGDHQDPQTTLLLYRRTDYPLGAPPHFASSTALALGNPVQSRPRSIASHTTPSLTAPSSPDPLTGQPIVPANSRQVSPRGAPLACTLPNSARHGHRGPPPSGLCGHLTPSSSPSIGIWPGPFAFPYPSAPVSTPEPIPSVDSGLSDHPKSQVVASSAASALELIANEWETGRGSPYHAVRIIRLALRVKDILNKDMLVRAQQAVFTLNQSRGEIRRKMG